MTFPMPKITFPSVSKKMLDITYYARFLVPLMLIWLGTGIYFHRAPFNGGFPSHGGTKVIPTNMVAEAWKQEIFVRQVLETEIDGPYDIKPLTDFCKDPERHNQVPGLIFRCDYPIGGIGNVKNIILNCLRFAFQAGGWSSYTLEVNTANLTAASGFILPRYVCSILVKKCSSWLLTTW